MASTTNSLYVTINANGNNSFYAGSSLVLGGGFIGLNATLIIKNTGSNVYNAIINFNGSPTIEPARQFSATRIA